MNTTGVNQYNSKFVARSLAKKVYQRSTRHCVSIQRSSRSKMVSEEEVNYEIGQRIETQEDAVVFIKAETEKGTILSERGYGACKPPFSYWPYFLRCVQIGRLMLRTIEKDTLISQLLKISSPNKTCRTK